MFVLSDLEVDLLPGVNSARLVGVWCAEIGHRLAEVIGPVGHGGGESTSEIVFVHFN